jgi:SWIM zinc finger
MRSSRRTIFSVGAGGFGVTTEAPGMQAHFERKVQLPESWLKGFLQVQSALALRPFLFDVRPADLLTAIAIFQDTKPPRPPHGLRYELTPGTPVRVLVEPWDTPVIFRGTAYDGYARTVRVWGRKRLDLLRAVLPYAQKVTIGLLGRGLPHLYICHCGAYQFTLMLSGWTRNDWAAGSAFEQLAPQGPIDAERIATVYACLVRRLAATRREIVIETGLASDEVEHALFRLCRAGRVMADPIGRRFRLRELFAEPLDMDALFTPDPRLAQAQDLRDAGRVAMVQITPPEQNETGRRETRVRARVTDGETHEVTVSVDLDGRLRFGRCTCAFFQHHLMSRGPCEHIQAARLQFDRQTVDAAAAISADGEGHGR